MARTLALGHPPTGLVVANTAQVRDVLRMLAQARIAIPDDLSLVIFDDNPLSHGPWGPQGSQ